jgi:hypothetical protein
MFSSASSWPIVRSPYLIGWFAEKKWVANIVILEILLIFTAPTPINSKYRNNTVNDKSCHLSALIRPPSRAQSSHPIIKEPPQRGLSSAWSGKSRPPGTIYIITTMTKIQEPKIFQLQISRSST